MGPEDNPADDMPIDREEYEKWEKDQMPCPTCSHTMQRLTNERRLFWCSRCGTLKEEIMGTSHLNGKPEQVVVADQMEYPILVNRLREFEPSLGPHWLGLWRKLGIHESIHRPEDRPAFVDGI